MRCPKCGSTLSSGGTCAVCLAIAGLQPGYSSAPYATGQTAPPVYPAASYTPPSPPRFTVRPPEFRPGPDFSSDGARRALQDQKRRFDEESRARMEESQRRAEESRLQMEEQMRRQQARVQEHLDQVQRRQQEMF